MKPIEKSLITLTLFIFLSGLCAEFLDVASGTGVQIGDMSILWAGLSLVFSLLCIALFFFINRILWSDDLSAQFRQKGIRLRASLGFARWALAGIILCAPVYLFQFTLLGIIFPGFFTRTALWITALLFTTFLLASDKETFLPRQTFAALLLGITVLVSVLASLKLVTDYPFSLGWSEGNRLWDYSILFGRNRYNYPAEIKIPVFLDFGRQFIGGLPFLLPNLTIWQERLWLGLISILPYLLLGLAAFRHLAAEKRLWLAATLWTYLFLQQGPIGIPLILCAVLITLAWKSKLWFALPLVIITTYAAYISRYTWLLAPGAWFFLLELFDGLQAGRPTKRARFLLLLMGIGGVGGLLILGVALAAYYQMGWAQNLPAVFQVVTTALGKISRQPLLWYRLLPNETYESGILLGTAIATLPLIVLLAYRIQSDGQRINGWQKTVLVLPLLAFFAVGLVVSAKIGGGGDLHNMDMFLVTLFFAAVALLHQQGSGWIQNPRLAPTWVWTALLCLIALPGISPLLELRSYKFGAQAGWLATLTDAPNERALEMLPTDEVIKKSLKVLQAEVDAAQPKGGILFMDQRQLLTFGYLQGVPLLPQYDKKVLMDQAMSSNQAYFQFFYDDLAARRFSLIVTQPLVEKTQGTDEFGEENNAWVKWVTKPLLCFYQVQQTLADVNVQLLVPREGEVNCTKVLP